MEPTRWRMCAMRPIWLGIVLFLASCGGGGGESDGILGEPDPGDSGEPVETARLQRFSTAEELESYLKEGIRSQGSWDDSRTGEPAVPDADGEAGAPAYAPDVLAYSGTNLQVAGVDEADSVKTDGRTLYVLVSSDVFHPGLPEAAANLFPPPAGDTPYVRILRLSDDPPDSREVARLDFDEFQNRVDALYLVTDREDDAPDLLVTVGGSAADVWGDWFCPVCWGNGTAEIGLFDVDDPENPARIARMTFDGRLIASRRIGNRLYLVTRYTPELPDFEFYPRNADDMERNERILAGAGLSELLPRMSLDGADRGELVVPERSFLPPRDDGALPEPGLITAVALNLARPGEKTTQTVAGAAETLYVSTESLYVATTRYPYVPPAERTDDALAVSALPPETTEIHKFRMTEDGPVYAGSGTVPGNLGWETGKRPFRMSEFEGTLRVATSLGDTWNETSRTRLNLLREGEGGRLEETGFVDHIGKVGERLYASRFVGARGFLVTFRVTDPLYVFDLSDPWNPVQAGELQIEGYSDYLHPIGEDRLLGIGKDAVPDESGDLGGRGAWYQGVKLSLFDISDPASPFEIDSVVYGKRGTESEALTDHHGLAYLPPRDGAPARLALPIRLNDTPRSDQRFDPDNPSAYYDWTRTGLYLFEIDGAGIDSAGEIVVADRLNGDSPPWQFSGDRAVLVEDAVHYIHDGGVWSSVWGAGSGVNGPN